MMQSTDENATGWVVTFIIDERGGGPDAGYISVRLLFKHHHVSTHILLSPDFSEA